MPKIINDKQVQQSINREMQRKLTQRRLPAVSASSSSSSSTSTSTIAVPAKKIVTVIGDSTFDNGAWVGTRYALLVRQATKDGLLGSAFLGLIARSLSGIILGLEQNDDIQNDTQWPIERHLRHLLGNEYHLVDRTVDGFTTTDVLTGAYEDKVGLPNFVHRKFYPLDEHGQAAIAASDAVVISVGGNNVREFILELAQHEGDRAAFIKANYPALIAKLQKEYIEILQKVHGYNPQARIVIMTQYYPGLKQVAGFGDFIYGFMQELGAVLHTSDPTFPTDPEQVIQRVITDTYRSGLKFLAENNIRIAIADVTSSINPTTLDNHINQIEPSHQGGEKIAHMLATLIKGGPEVEGKIHQFNFRTGRVYSVHETPVSLLKNWEPRSISSFRWGKWKLWFDNPLPSVNVPNANSLDDDDFEHIKVAKQ